MTDENDRTLKGIENSPSLLPLVVTEFLLYRLLVYTIVRFPHDELFCVPTASGMVDTTRKYNFVLIGTDCPPTYTFENHYGANNLQTSAESVTAILFSLRSVAHNLVIVMPLAIRSGAIKENL